MDDPLYLFFYIYIYPLSDVFGWCGVMGFGQLFGSMGSGRLAELPASSLVDKECVDREKFEWVRSFVC